MLYLTPPQNYPKITHTHDRLLQNQFLFQHELKSTRQITEQAYLSNSVVRWGHPATP